MRTPLLALLALGIAACGRPDAPAEGPASTQAPATADTVAPSAWALELRTKADDRALEQLDTARIVSVGGPVTEIVFALGAGPRVVGVDRTSVYPEAAQALPSVGMFGQLSAEGLLALDPTVVIATAEAGPPVVIEQLVGAGIDVVMVPDVTDGAEAVARVEALGAVLGARDVAATVAARLTEELAASDSRAAALTAPPKTLFVYARGTRTLLVSGADTPAARMIALAGGENAISAFDGFKPLTAEGVVDAAPDWILIPRRGLASVGDIEGLLKLPGVALTPAGRARRVIAVDDLALLGFGPRTPEALRVMQDAWAEAR